MTLNGNDAITATAAMSAALTSTRLAAIGGVWLRWLRLRVIARLSANAIRGTCTAPGVTAVSVDISCADQPEDLQLRLRLYHDARPAPTSRPGDRPSPVMRG